MIPAASSPEPLAATAPRASEERVHALDALRAVAMFLGIVLHAGMAYAADLPIRGMVGDVSKHWGFTALLGFIHGFRMHLFFLLSGFFGRLVYERLGEKEFIKQRLKRIGIPFALGMVTVMPAVVALAVWEAIRNGQDASQLQNGAGRFDGVPTMHLWFLNYLLVLYAGALLVVRVVPEKAARGLDWIFMRMFRSPLRIVALAPITVAIIWNGPLWGDPPLPIFSITPEPITFSHYALFFAVGWWLHRNRAELNQTKHFLKSTALVAMASLVIMGALLSAQQNTGAPNYFLLKFGYVFSAATYAWTMTFLLIGIFLKFANAARPWVRYMADASYWCYLAHLPIIMAFQIWTAQWRVPAVIKFTVILAITSAILLATYHWRVRYTWVGRLLNGPRAKGA